MVVLSIKYREDDCLINGIIFYKWYYYLSIKNPIELSKHSYIDIIDALNDITLQRSFKLVAVLLEQLVYKSNRKLQYDVKKLSIT
jgi:hypothetical protein